MSNEYELNETMRILAGKPGTLYQESSEKEKATFRKWLSQLLQSQEIEVEFVKSDGSLRAMRCTLKWDELPVTQQSVVIDESIKGKKPRATNDEVCKIWDLDSKAWRSFRYDRIKSITIDLG